jgi:spermidine/putrescine transport system permease protein
MMRLFAEGRVRLDLAGVLLVVVAMATYVFLYTPTVIMGIMSFNASRMPIFPMKGFTLYWYNALFNDGYLLTSLKNSVIVGLPSAAIATVLGTMAAFGLVRHRVRGSDAVITFALLPFITPKLILAVGLLCLFSLLGIKGSLFLVMLAHVMLTIPIALLFIMVRLSRLPNHVEDAAANLGASKRKVFQYITLPLLMPSIIAAFLFSFCISFDEVLIAFFTTGRANTLPIHIWGILEHRLSPKVVALATSLSLLTAIITVILWTILNRGQKRSP